MSEWPSEENVRGICSTLLTELPDEALYELYETMVGMRDFYSDSVPHAPEAPPPPLPSRPAIVLPPTVREDYPFDPDEIS